jgi:hypothetical protein
VTFGFVDRGVSSVGLVWARDSALDRDWNSSGFGWTPSRPLPFCCPEVAFPQASRRIEEGQSTTLALGEPEATLCMESCGSASHNRTLCRGKPPSSWPLRPCSCAGGLVPTDIFVTHAVHAIMSPSRERRPRTHTG